MNDTVDIPCVSTIEPEFAIVDERPVCTRTWPCAADPQLSFGQVVDIGGTDCDVIDKISGARFVTYKFSPSGL
jgi:hypothetical protein